MLCSLTIQNFAIIDRLDLEFGPGFNVLTGETGAGKSILIDALNLLLGGRAGSEMVRAGARKAVLDAVFDLTGSPDAQRVVGEMGFELEDAQLLLSREVNAAGKSLCRICGRPATVGQLKEIGDWLVDLHGQHEHQSLLVTARHIDVLDEWGGKAVVTARTQVAAAFAELQSLRREKQLLESDARERAHLIDLYAFQVKEITDAGLVPGEEAELEAEYRRAANAQKLSETAAAVVELLGGDDSGSGVSEMLSRALRLLEDAAALDNSLSASCEAVRASLYELSEVERDLTHYQDKIELSPERLAEIEERRELLRALRRKYGDSVADILQYLQETAATLDRISHHDERGAQLDEAIAAATDRLTVLSEQLSGLRQRAATEFQAVVLGELHDLAMEKSGFEVRLERCAPASRGIDRVEFLIATNPGEPLRPLTRIASGGEISRVMLAIKSAMSRQEPLPTLVFDEIDVGVGGRTASVIAEKLASLARAAQILCITHLAQIASRGETHFFIEKQTDAERATVQLIPLTAEQRIQEIARMLGGVEVTETVLRHAREMLNLAETHLAGPDTDARKVRRQKSG